jgi:hypothetical protein
VGSLSASPLGELVADAVAKAREPNEVRLMDHASDAVLGRIDALFANENSVGKPMELGKLEAARAEAERRGKEHIPPGYRDKNKTKGDPAGDYIVWRQLMDEAKTRKLPVVFVTDDTKEDWYQREHGQTLGARRRPSGLEGPQQGVRLGRHEQMVGGRMGGSCPRRPVIDPCRLGGRCSVPRSEWA